MLSLPSTSSRKRLVLFHASDPAVLLCGCVTVYLKVLPSSWGHILGENKLLVFRNQIKGPLISCICRIEIILLRGVAAYLFDVGSNRVRPYCPRQGTSTPSSPFYCSDAPRLQRSPSSPPACIRGQSSLSSWNLTQLSKPWTSVIAILNDEISVLAWISGCHSFDAPGSAEQLVWLY